MCANGVSVLEGASNRRMLSFAEMFGPGEVAPLALGVPLARPLASAVDAGIGGESGGVASGF